MNRRLTSTDKVFIVEVSQCKKFLVGLAAHSSQRDMAFRDIRRGDCQEVPQYSDVNKLLLDYGAFDVRGLNGESG